MHKVITMSDRDYFQYGKYFLQTRNRINADFVLYTSNLTGEQIKICRKHDIEVKFVNSKIWELRMQTLKFRFLLEELSLEVNCFCDFDTFFLKDFIRIILHQQNDFSLGITTTEGYKQNVYDRAKANGGVIFAYSNSVWILKFAIKCINLGGHKDLPEYDQIWKTLEDPKRAEHKRHSRWNQRWWCDQVFLSALVLAKDRFDVSLFPCKKFNALDADPSIIDNPGCVIKDNGVVENDIYIGHLKNSGRGKI